MAATTARREANWPMRVDEREYIGWAQYVEQWLGEQKPRHAVNLSAYDRTPSYSDAPWATSCLLDAMND